VPWLITEEGMQTILDILNPRLDGTVYTKEEIRMMMGDEPSQRSTYSSQHRNVGVMTFDGPLFPKANLMTDLSGAISIEQARKEFSAMVADDSISSILMSFDSPGGSSEMMPEFAQDIFEAREQKRIVSIANMSANSGAYYLASQATEMYATPSGQVGSIGVIMVHKDDTRRRESAGIDNTVISAGKLKSVGYTPLTSDGKAYLQDFVDDTYEDFVSAVARGRAVTTKQVKEGFGHGGVVNPQNALSEGMIDGVATFDEVLSDMSTTGGGSVSNTNGGTTSAKSRLSTSTSYDADKEHSEPGTGQGGEPTPREPPEKDDLAIAGGWRRDTPPIEFEPEERSAMNREMLVALAARLGMSAVSDETTDEELSQLVFDEVNEFIKPIVDASASAQTKQDFNQQFPEQAKELAALKETNKVNAAKTFAASFEKFEGSDKGFAPVVLDLLEDAHVKIAERTFVHADLQNLLQQTISEDGIVTYGEKGSNRSDELVTVRAGANRQEVRKQYADELHRIMEEDSLDTKAAMNVLAEKNPELAHAYITS